MCNKSDFLPVTKNIVYIGEQEYTIKREGLHKVYMLTTRMYWRCAWLPATDVNNIIRVITLHCTILE
jgi:hypothetical protein